MVAVSVLTVGANLIKAQLVLGDGVDEFGGAKTMDFSRQSGIEMLVKLPIHLKKGVLTQAHRA